jgi:hypothetical protein
VTLIVQCERLTDYWVSVIVMWETNWLLIDSNLLKTVSNCLLNDSYLLKIESNWLLSEILVWCERLTDYWVTVIY